MGDRAAKSALFAEFAAVGKALPTPAASNSSTCSPRVRAASTSSPTPPTWASRPARPTCSRCAKPAWSAPYATASASSTSSPMTTSPSSWSTSVRWRCNTDLEPTAPAARTSAQRTPKPSLALSSSTGPDRRPVILDVRPDTEYAAVTSQVPSTFPSTLADRLDELPIAPRSSPTAAAPTASWPTTPSASSTPAVTAPAAPKTAPSNGAPTASSDRTTPPDYSQLPHRHDLERWSGNPHAPRRRPADAVPQGDGVTCAVAGQQTPDGYYTLDRMLKSFSRTHIACCTCLTRPPEHLIRTNPST